MNVKGNLKVIFKAIISLITGKNKAKRPGIPKEKEREKTYTGVEHRKYPRLDMKSAVNYLAYSPTGIKKDEQTYTRNISGGGICISTVDCITRSIILELEIKIPGYGSTINALARVVYSRERKTDNDFDTGVCFTNIFGEEKKYIIEYTDRAIQGTNMKEGW